MVKVQWYPGHMEKARRNMLDRLKQVDMVIEVRDARIPEASRNPILVEMAGKKPRLIVLSKSDMADPDATKEWIAFLSKDEVRAIALDFMHDNKAGRKLIQECLQVMKPWRDRQSARGIRPRSIRAMAAGIPNVGKSTMVNRIAGKNIVKAADQPGVTKSLTWIHCGKDLDLLDTPGVLWPRFEDEKTGSLLAALGAINDNILNEKMVAMDAIHIIQDLYPGLLENIYQSSQVNPNGMLKAIAAQRNLLEPMGNIDTRRAAELFLNELRKGKLGRLTLERANDETKESLPE